VATFGVTITTNTTPAISVTLSNTTTYQQFKNSLGAFTYDVDYTYVYSNLLQQIQGGFNYSKYDSGGNQNLQTVLSTIDPYQTQNSLYIDTTKKNLILDGRDYVRFNMYPNATLQVKLFCRRIANVDGLDYLGINNFKSFERQSGKINFFEDYVDLV
jgi:hypothetical protein